MTQLDDVSRVLGELTSEVRNLNRKVERLEEKVEELTGLRKVGIGVVIGLSALSALIGSKFATLIHLFK